VRRRFKKGESVFNSGDRFAALYAIRSGSCKLTIQSEDGREQVSGYHIMGDIMGFDGIGSGQHGGWATALENTEVCVIPFGQLEELCQRSAPLPSGIMAASPALIIPRSATSEAGDPSSGRPRKKKCSAAIQFQGFPRMMNS